MSRGNFNNHPGPKSLATRLNQLRGLRNVGIKIATNKQYLDQMYDDGMDFVSKRKKREAARIDNEFTRVVRDNIVKPSMFNKNYEAPKEWIEDYEAKKEAHQLSIEDARRINQKTKTQNTLNYSTGFSITKPTNRASLLRRYGYSPVPVWVQTQTGDGDDDWYNEYARLQSSKTYY